MEATCQKCGYEWDYTGRLNRATCPNCGAKVIVPDRDDQPKDETETGDQPQ